MSFKKAITVKLTSNMLDRPNQPFVSSFEFHRINAAVSILSDWKNGISVCKPHKTKVIECLTRLY